jgi:HEAT repeat protein
MKIIVSILVFFGFLVLGSPIVCSQEDEILTFILRNLNVVEYNANHQERLQKLGKKAHPVFLRMLNDEKTSTINVLRILGLLQQSREDRAMFLEPTVSRLNDAYWGTRMEAAHLLGEIGTAKEAPPLIALLNDAESGTAGSAALALGKIGGRRELLALQIWLKNSDQADVALVKDVNTAIDQIRKRIEKKNAK